MRASRHALWWLPVNHASRFHARESRKGKKMSDISGRNLPAPLARLSPDGSCWRTCQACLPWPGSSDRYSQTWPRAGLMLHGLCYRRAPWVRHTHGKGCSLWPTPTAAMASRGWGFSSGTQRYRRETIERALETGYKPSLSGLEAMMAFPPMWTAVDVLEMLFTQTARNGSGAA